MPSGARGENPFEQLVTRLGVALHVVNPSQHDHRIATLGARFQMFCNSALVRCGQGAGREPSQRIRIGM